MQPSLLKMRLTHRSPLKKAWQLILPGGLPGPVAIQTGIHVQVTANFSRVSLITMLAPSPDWFIGIDSLDLCDNGKWRESWNVTMSPPWDAGTEAGLEFKSTDVATNANIFLITNNTDGAFKNDKPIPSLGEFLFTGIGLPVLPQASSTTASSSTPAPPMDKSTTAMPSDNAVVKACFSFVVLIITSLILALLF